MNLNESSLRHPRTQWAIEAAMWRAIELSRESYLMRGQVDVLSSNGKVLMTITHYRDLIGAFNFWRLGNDVTDQMLDFLRSNR